MSSAPKQMFRQLGMSHLEMSILPPQILFYHHYCAPTHILRKSGSCGFILISSFPLFFVELIALGEALFKQSLAKTGISKISNHPMVIVLLDMPYSPG